MTSDEAARVIAAELPHLAGRPVIAIGEGLDHSAFEVGGEWIVRIPRHAVAAAGLAREVRLTRALQALLPLAIPSYGLEGGAERGAPRLAAYRKLAGIPALLAGEAPLEGAGRALGAFLAALHAVDPAVALEAGLDREDLSSLSEWSREALEELRRCRARGRLAEPRWERVLASPPAGGDPPLRLVHGDLAAEHVLVDARGLPTGVIDWSDACLGDPARDLAGLVHWGGEPLLLAALETYGPVDAATRARAGWYAACRGVADVAFGDAQGRPEYVAAGGRALAALERAFPDPRGPLRGT